MDYLEIIVKGYFDKINRKFLKEYFLRELKKAEKEYFSPEVFFTGCLTIVQELEEHIKAKLHDRKEYLQRQINDAKNGLSLYRDMEGKTIEQKRQETIENCTLQLSRLSEDDITIQPNEIAKPQLPAPIYKKDLLIIKRAIQEAQSNIKPLPHQPIDVNKNRTKKVIAETFENMDKKGWKYAFTSEQDYNLFTDLLTNFFEFKPYTLPDTIIQLKRATKTKVAKVLGEIHKELSNENKLSTDTNYFQLIRVLSHFEKETQGDLYKALTR